MPQTDSNDSPLPEPWTNVSTTMAKLLGGFAVVVLLGWVFGFEVLTRWNLTWAATTPYTATGFALSALAVLFLGQGERGRRKAVGLALTLGGGAILVLGDHIFGWSGGGAGREALNSPVDPSGANRWMSIGSSIGFLNVAVTIFLAHRSDARLFWVSTGFAGIVALMGAIVVSGYIFSSDVLYELEAFSTMALPTAVAFFCLGVALLTMPQVRQFTSFVQQREMHPLFFRCLVPAVMGLPLLVGWSILMAERHGLVRFELGVVLGGAFYAAGIGALVWGVADRMEEATRTRYEFAQKLKESEKWAQEMVAALPQLVWTCGADGSCDFVNDRWIEYSGGAREEEVRSGWLARVHPEDRHDCEAAWQQSRAQGGDLVIECRLERGDGVHRWFHVTAKALRDQSGKITKWFGSCTDVDDMKLAAEMIAESRDKLEQRVRKRTKKINAQNQELIMRTASLKEAQALAKLGSWTMVVKSGEVTWSDQLYSIFDIAPEDGPPNYEDQSQLFAPASWTALSTALNQARKSGQGYRLTLNVVTQQGVNKWVIAEGKATKDESGKVVRIAGTCMDITESYFVQRELELASLRLKLAVESANMGVWDWDISSGELSWDETMRRLYEHTGSIDYETWCAAIWPDDQGEMERALKDALAGIRDFDHHFRILGSDGKIKHFRGRSIVIRDSIGHPLRMIGVNQDVTTEWDAVRKLQKSEALTREFVRHAPAAIAMLDRELNYVQVSDQWCRDFEVSKSDGAGSSRFEVSDFQPEEWATIYPKILAGGFHAPTESRLIDPQGKSVWLQWEMRPWLQKNGEVGGILISSQFTTKRKELELRLRERERELERSNRDLEQFAYVASHDLQEPLRAVSGCVQLLQKRYGDQLDEEAGMLIGHTVAGAKRMQELIHDLLIYSRVGSKSDPFEEVNLKQPFELALSNISKLIAESRLAVEVACDFPTLKIDRIQIASLFQNLISNAIKYRADSRPPKIMITAIEEEKSWTGIVRDNGMGIDARHWDRVFKIFQRLHTRSEIPGSGIGLSICAKIAERHNGKIWIEESSHEGTEIRFNLPKN